MKDRNENRPGYKKTKVGWIPEEWQCGNFSDIASVVMGQSPDGKSYNKSKQGMPLINGPTEFTKRHPAKKQWTTNPIKVCASGDILLCVRGSSTGRLNIADDIYCIGRGIAAVREKKSRSCSFFIEHTLSNITKRILRLSSGSTFPNIDKKNLSNISIAIPTFQEQEKIAEILSTWDETIEQTRKLIEAKKRRKNALMQQLLTGRKRLPGFNEQWKQLQLGELASVIFSNVDKKVANDEIPVRLCNYLDVYYNDRITRDMHLMNATARNVEIAKYRLAKNDVIITKDSETAVDIAVPCYVAEEIEDIVCGYHLAIIRPRPEKLYGPFLSYLLMTDQVHYQFVRIANGVTRFGLTNGSVKRIKIRIPPVVEQRHIAEILFMAYEEIETLETKLSALEKQKRGLMQKLLTGEVRVKL